MANIVGLALKVTGDASGLAKSLTPVDRALDKLAAQAEKATSVFTPFAEKTAAAGRAQEEFAAKFSALADQLRANLIGPQEYAAAFGRLTEEAKGTAAAFQEGLRITQQNQTAEQARTSGLERLNELLRLGAIDARNFGLEAAKLSEGSDSTALDRFAEAVAPLRVALESGTLSAERFAEQSQEIAAAISGSTPAAERQATAILELRNRFEAGRVSIEQYREEFSRIQSGDIATTFEVQVVGVREGVEASNELRASLAQLTDTQITAALHVAGVEKLDDLRQQFAGVDGAQIDAVLSVLGVETIEEARQQLESLANVDASATVSIANAAEVQNTIRLLESSFGSLEAAQSRLESLPDVDLKATLEVLGVDSIDAARERLIALGALQIEPKLQAIGFENIDAAQSAIDSLSDRSVTATLEFLGAGDISDAAEKLATLDGTTVEAFLRASGFESIDAAQTKLGELQDVDVTATLQLLGVDTIDAARDRLSQLGDLQIEPRLQAIGFDSIDAARAALESLGDRSITATLEFLGTDSIDDARERLGVLDGTTVEAFLRASGFESIDAAQEKLAELQSVDVAATLTVLGVDTIDEARQRLASLSTVDIEPVLRLLGVDSIADAQQQLAAVNGTEIDTQLRVLGIDGIESARTLIASVEGKNVDLIAKTFGIDSVASLTQAIDAAESKTVTFDVASNANEEADRIAELVAEQEAYKAAAAEGLRITEQVRTAEEQRATELAKLEGLLSQGAISQETFVRASERATGVEKQRADAAASAARIIAANLSPQERYSQQMQELSGHLEAGRLSQDQFNRAAQRAKIDLDNIGKEADRADNILEKLNKNLNFLKNVAIGRLVLDGVRALGNAFASVQNQISGLVTSANSSVDQLNDFAQRTGIGVESLQGYSVAAKLAGVDTEQFGTAVQKLAVNIGKATPGDALDKSLKAINLSVRELRALSPEQQFSAIGNAISTLPTVADRAAAAVEVFGKQGAALAPLFREGADSIEELQARAERLGLIVDEAQVNNVASMNDAFDLVAATVQGITGQVIGNLAPAVTDVTNQFLRFVEEFAGVDGQGGTGIANAITDTLLRGAEYFAGIFDEYVEYFGGFTGALNTASEAFNQITGVLQVLSGVFRSIFNTFEIIGNGIAVALGKALEAIGSYVSTDLENFGRDLQLDANAQLQQNLAELESAGQQIINGTTQAVFGNAADQRSAATSAATTYLEGLRAQIERERSPQFKVETDIEQTRERFDSFFSGIVDQSSTVTQAMRGFEAAAASVIDPLNITADEIARIKLEQDKVNRAIDQELGSRRQIADAAIAQAEADTKRIAELTKATDAQTKLAEDLAVVEREQSRVREQLQAAREAASLSLSESDRIASQAQADAAAASLASLDQIEAKLKETQQAGKQGFSEGFTKQFEETAKAIDAARAKASEFGKVGVRAQLELAQAVAVLQERARAGFLNKAEYDRELARQQGFFDEALKREQENQRLIAQAKQAANVRVEEFLKGKIDERAKFEIARQEEAANRRQRALENVAAIEERIAVQEKSVQAARDAGDLKSAKARASELNTLKQARVAEQRIADGRNAAARNQASGLAGGFRQAEQFQSRIAQTNDNFLRAFSGTYAQASASLNAANAVAAELARQQELSRPVAGSVSTADIRTAEGAALVLGLGAAAQDPALIEARLQTKQLAGIRTAINNAVTGYIGTVAEIF